MKRLAYLYCLSLSLTAAVPVSGHAQTGFVAEARASCATDVAATKKHLVEIESFTEDEADNRRINPRIDDISTLPRYALEQTAERTGDEPMFALQRCAARLRLNQLLADAPPPLTPEALAATQRAARSRCIGSVPALKAFMPELTESQYGPLLDKMVEQISVMGVAERDAFLSKGGGDDPVRPLTDCVGGVVKDARSGGGAQIAVEPTPPGPTPAAQTQRGRTAPQTTSNANGATPEQIADAEARNAQARAREARLQAESDTMMRNAAIRDGKIYQSNGPEGRRVDLHPRTNQRCVSGVLGPKEPYGSDGVVHVIEFTNVCDKIFSVRARIVPLGPISDTSGGVQGTGINPGSLDGPSKSRVICVQKPNREVGTCTGFSEWWAYSSS